LAWIAFAFVGGLKTIVPGGLERGKGKARPGRPVRIARVALLAVVVSCAGAFVSGLLAPDWCGMPDDGASQL
jgi:hypothetical protein